jgi:hypothetical protein
MRSLKEAPVFEVPSVFETANEPSDINWENRQSKVSQFRRISLLLIYLLIILMGNLVIQVYSQQTWDEA